MKKKIIFILSITILVSTFAVYASTPSKDNNKEIKKEISINKKQEEKETNNNLIKVDVKGEVINPGVYELKNNSRVIDAIIAAGGMTDNATTDAINLSKILDDESVIIIYNLYDENKSIEKYKDKINECNKSYNDACITNEVVSMEDNTNDTDTKLSISDKINLNTATVDELTQLKGIGEGKAQKNY